MKRLPSFRVFITRAGRIYKLELPAQKRDKLLPPGGALPYLGYTGTCRWIGYGFLASLS